MEIKGHWHHKAATIWDLRSNSVPRKLEALELRTSSQLKIEKSLLFPLSPEAGLLVASGEVADKDDGEDEGAPLDRVLEGAEVRLGRLHHLKHLLEDVQRGHDEDAELTHPLKWSSIDICSPQDKAQNLSKVMHVWS